MWAISSPSSESLPTSSIGFEKVLEGGIVEVDADDGGACENDDCRVPRPFFWENVPEGGIVDAGGACENDG